MTTKFCDSGIEGLNLVNIMKTDIAVFGGGCFWCTEAIFKELRGVHSVTPGYAGGDTPSPTYEEVSNGNTGHAEVIRIEFDPTVISYHDLLDVFMHTHDPTTRNQQGNDVGTQYRSIILYTSETQQSDAQLFMQELQSTKEFLRSNIVTELQPLVNFTEAENYHKDYYANNESQPYCQIVISPKLAKLRAKYREKLM
jgi:peptide-methionine (S)-S-oxide reductase